MQNKRTPQISQENLKKAAQEFIESQKTFHKAMQEFVKAVDSLLLQESLFSEEEKETLKEFLEPYRILIRNPFADLKSPSSNSEINRTIENICQIIYYDTKFQDIENAIQICTQQYDNFRKTMGEICERNQEHLEKFAAQLTENEKENWNKLFCRQGNEKKIQLKGDEIIKPTQNGTRYKLFLKNLPERIEEIITLSKSSSSTEQNKSLKLLQKQLIRTEKTMGKRLSNIDKELEIPKQPHLILRIFKAIFNFFKSIFTTPSDEKLREVELQSLETLVEDQESDEGTSGSQTKDREINPLKKEKDATRQFLITSEELKDQKNALRKQKKDKNDKKGKKRVIKPDENDFSNEEIPQKENKNFAEKMRFFKSQEDKEKLLKSSNPKQEKSIEAAIKEKDEEIKRIKKLLENGEKRKTTFKS